MYQKKYKKLSEPCEFLRPKQMACLSNFEVWLANLQYWNIAASKNARKRCAQIIFGDITPYLTYDCKVTLKERENIVELK